jgi:hypothetical protein
MIHFKIQIFVQDSFLRSSKQLNFENDSEAVVYFCGTIKNLSENNKLLKKLSSKNVEEILVKLIKEPSKYIKVKENDKDSNKKETEEDKKKKEADKKVTNIKKL